MLRPEILRRPCAHSRNSSKTGFSESDCESVEAAGRDQLCEGCQNRAGIEVRRREICQAVHRSSAAAARPGRAARGSSSISRGSSDPPANVVRLNLEFPVAAQCQLAAVDCIEVSAWPPGSLRAP